MKKIGIICEYNPLHNGHIYHLNKIKEMYPDSIIILVLGGYFLERGEVSTISKWNKTKLALDAGIDCVMELPTLYNTNSGDIFAYRSIEILNALEVDCIVFGSETDDIETLKSIAHKQKDEDFQSKVKEYLNRGSNYPTSLALAASTTLESNDILGVSYIKAIEQINDKIEPITIRRTNKFRDTLSNEQIVSAENIRSKLKKQEDIKRYIPDYDINYINDVDYKKLFCLIRYRILTDSHLERYLGVDEGLENRLKKVILKVDDYDSLVDALSTKRYTKSRIKRMLLHILLGIEKSDVEFSRSEFRILGFNKLGKEYLRKLNNKNLKTKVNDTASNIEARAALIYSYLTGDESVDLEFKNKPIIK